MKTFLLACCLLIFFAAFGQAKPWDSTFKPASWKREVEQFKQYPNSKKDIIFLGNSITAGVDWAEILKNPHVRNRGISSDITFGVLDRLGEVTEGQPAKVFILIGINDISRNIPDSVIIKNYQRMIDRIKTESPSTKIYFQTLLPVNNEYTTRGQFNKDEHILFVNQELKKITEREKICLIDLHKEFLGADNKLDKKYTYDGLHLNPEGYNHWVEILKKGKYLEK